MKYIIISIIILQSFFATAQPDRKNAPEATAPQALELGEFSEIKLDNGMEIFLVKRPGYPKFTMSMSIDQPDINKDPQQEKRNILSAAYSKRACKEYTEEEVKKMTTYLGAQMGASFNGGFIKGMKRDANTLLEVFSKQLLYPLITQEDIDEKAKAYNKNQKNKASKPIKSELRNFSNHLTDSLVYGSMQTAKKKQQELDYSDVTIANIWEYHKERLSGANTTIVLVGNFSEKEVKSLFNKYFSAFPKGEKLVKDVDVIDGKSILTDRQIYVIDNPLANQSKISFHWGIDGAFPYSNEEYKMQVMNEILGGSQLSYLYTNVREEKGLCYYIGANIGSSNAGGNASINTKVRTEEVNVAVENIILEMMRIRNKNVSEYDLKIAKNSLIGKFARSLSGISTVPYISYAMAKSDYNLPIDYLKNKIPNIYAVSVKDVKNMAEKYINPYECLVLVEGKADILRGKLERFGTVHYVDKEGIPYEFDKK